MGSDGAYGQRARTYWGSHPGSLLYTESLFESSSRLLESQYNSHRRGRHCRRGFVNTPSIQCGVREVWTRGSTLCCWYTISILRGLMDSCCSWGSAPSFYMDDEVWLGCPDGRYAVANRQRYDEETRPKRPTIQSHYGMSVVSLGCMRSIAQDWINLETSNARGSKVNKFKVLS